MSAAKQATKYLFAIATVYMCYLTHGVQAIIFSQNQVNFYTQWGFTDATAGAAAVSTAIMWVGIGKFISVWIGGEISDRIGRKIMAVGGGVLYIISFVIMLVTDNATVACVAGFLSGVATSGSGMDRFTLQLLKQIPSILHLPRSASSWLSPSPVSFILCS